MKRSRRASRAERPPFPPDAETRHALAESGMTPFAIERAMSQVLRLLRFDFFKRRKQRLYTMLAMRMGLVTLKEKVVAIANRHEKETGAALNADDFFVGAYKYLLVDFGPADVDVAIKELVGEGILRQENLGGIVVLRPTRKHLHVSTASLRKVLDQMKLHLGIRYAQEYDTEKTYQV
jgi:hypothetical protein